MTEAGDAALSADLVGTLRLWPALDGSRQAIPIAAMEPIELALATSGDELVAGVVDEAHTVHVLRIGRDGRIHGRAQVPGETAVRDVIAAGGDLLVLRADQSIERYDGRGVLHGRIVASPGERIGAIAARGGGAIVSVVAGEDTNAHAVRWIDLGDQLAWGDELALPSAIAPAPLALAPNRRRLAAAAATALKPDMPEDSQSHELVIFELHGGARPFAMPRIDIQHGAVIGFTDADHVAVEGARITWWAAAPRDTWGSGGDGGRPEPFGVRVLGSAAIGDGVAVAGYAAGLELANAQTTRYLGWGALSLGVTSVIGDRVVDGPGDGHITWLDDRLVEVGSTLQSSLHQPAPHEIVPVGDHQVLMAFVDGEKIGVALADVDRPKEPVSLGKYETVDHLDFEPALGIATIAHGERVERFRIDLAKLAATRLPALAQTGGVTQLRMLDPARAGGLVAIAAGYGDDGMRVATYRDGARTPTGHHDVGGIVLAIAASGTIYEKSSANPKRIVVRRGDRELGHFDLDPIAEYAETSRDGESLVVRRAQDIVLVARDGTVRWQHPLWNAATVAFTGDERRIIVRTGSGLVELDAATGAEVARACGWDFGLHELPLPSVTYGLAPVCEDAGP